MVVINEERESSELPLIVAVSSIVKRTQDTATGVGVNSTKTVRTWYELFSHCQFLKIFYHHCFIRRIHCLYVQVNDTKIWISR